MSRCVEAFGTTALTRWFTGFFTHPVRRHTGTWPAFALNLGAVLPLGRHRLPGRNALLAIENLSDCRATIKVRKPDNQDEKVVALLVS